MRRAATPEPQRDKYNKHVDRLTRHKNALIRLGYLEERKFQPEFLTMGSRQTEAMFKEFHRRHPGWSYSVGWGKALKITDRPERMPMWESLIEEYDVPPIDPNQPAALEDLPKDVMR